MKRGIALSGGGTKGSYELGVWKALRELGIDYQIVTGTSIGSINGALMTTGDYERAEELWNTITMEDMMEDGINLTTTIEGMYDQKDAIRPFLKKYVKNKGADISPFTEFIETLINEEKIRSAETDFGLVTVQFPSLKACELTKEEIPKGLLKEYILASAAIFPLFPMHKIGDQTYLDGCYHDNLPIDLALRMGAQEVIAVDLHTTPAHAAYANRPYVTYIKPSRSLGTMMNFDHALLMENARMGYCDTMKMFGKYLGYRYTFRSESVLRLEQEVAAYISFLAQTDLYLTDETSARKFGKGDFNRLFALLQEKAEGKRMDREQYFVRGAELCGQFLGLKEDAVYDMGEFILSIKEGLGGRERYQDAGELVRREGMELAAKLTELRLWQTKEYIFGCISYALEEKKDGAGRLILPLLSLFPEELAAALFVCSV